MESEYMQLIEKAIRNVDRYSFFQLVRLLRKAQFGETGNVGIHFCSAGTFRYPSSEIELIERMVNSSGKLEELSLQVNFMGLTGPSGVLSPEISLYLLGTGEDDRPALREFLAVFDNQYIWKYFRAWEKTQFAIRWEEAVRRGDQTTDQFVRAQHALVGLPGGNFVGRDKLRPESVIFYAGHFANTIRPAANLKLLLAQHIGNDVKVTQFVGEWLGIPLHLRSRLTASHNSNSSCDPQNSRLGTAAVLGSRYWSVQDRFNVEIHVKSYDEFEQLLPNGRLYPKLLSLVQFYVGQQYQFNVSLHLPQEQIPTGQLSSISPKSRMGWNTWLTGEKRPNHVVFRVDS